MPIDDAPTDDRGSGSGGAQLTVQSTTNGGLSKQSSERIATVTERISGFSFEICSCSLSLIDRDTFSVSCMWIMYMLEREQRFDLSETGTSPITTPEVDEFKQLVCYRLLTDNLDDYSNVICWRGEKGEIVKVKKVGNAKVVRKLNESFKKVDNGKGINR